jgi:hypothetical protein
MSPLRTRGKTGSEGEAMKLYIAGPMTGRPNLNYAEFNRWEQVFLKCGYQVLNPARIDLAFPRKKGEPKRDWAWYMSKAIPMVCEADGLAMLYGWSQSTGATEEHRIARLLQKKVHSAQWWFSMRDLYIKNPKDLRTVEDVPLPEPDDDLI